MAPSLSHHLQLVGPQLLLLQHRHLYVDRLGNWPEELFEANRHLHDQAWQELHQCCCALVLPPVIAASSEPLLLMSLEVGWCCQDCAESLKL